MTKSLTYATVYNTCFGLNEQRFVTLVQKRMSDGRLRTRYHWSRHVHKMLTTRNPSGRFAAALPFSFRHTVNFHLRLNRIAALCHLRRLQRALLVWIWRPGGPFFERHLAWKGLTSKRVWEGGAADTATGSEESRVACG